MSTNRRTVEAIYCDDLREEAGGKTTIVGWYPDSQVYLPEDGALHLSKLCILAIVRSSDERPIKKVQVELLADGKVIRSVELPPEALTEDGLPENGRFPIQVQMAMELPNMRADTPSKLWLRVSLGDEVIESNVFSIVGRIDATCVTKTDWTEAVPLEIKSNQI